MMLVKHIGMSGGTQKKVIQTLHHSILHMLSLAPRVYMARLFFAFLFSLFNLLLSNTKLKFAEKES